MLPMQALLVAMLMIGGLGIPLGLSLLFHLLLFSAAALACHGRLARSRPGVEHLTGYYLAIAFGGVLGGAWNAFVAPALFDSVVEYPLAIVLACALRPGRPIAGGRLASVASAVLPVHGRCAHVRDRSLGQSCGLRRAAPRGRAGSARAPRLRVASRPLRFAAAVGLMLLAGSLATAATARPSTRSARSSASTASTRTGPTAAAC